MRIGLNILLGSFILFFISCNGGGDESKDGTNNETTKEDVKIKVKQTGETISDYFSDRKDSLIVEGSKNLDEIGREIAALENQLEENSDKMEEKLKKQRKETVATLKDQRADLKNQLKKLENSSEDAWNDVSQSFQKASKNMQEGLEKAKDEFENESKNNN